MEYSLRQGSHTYFYEVDYGEELQTARITVGCDAASVQGLFIVNSSGALLCGADLPGYDVNPLRADGLWPSPPEEAIADARRISQAKML